MPGHTAIRLVCLRKTVQQLVRVHAVHAVVTADADLVTPVGGEDQQPRDNRDREREPVHGRARPVGGSGAGTSRQSDAARHFPGITLYDNVACQHRLLTEVLGVERIALVAGWSMGGCQSYQWASQYPDMVDAILPFCASAKTSPHNFVFLDGVRVALQADCAWNGGDYTEPPVVGLRAFGHIYAGWAFSQTWYREELYRELGHETVEDLLVDWEEDHAKNWDANDLLAKLWSWQQGDISANPAYGGDIARALGAIRARAILMPCTTDLYFPPEDNAIEARLMPNAELRPFDSPWGHAVASPGLVADFTQFHDDACRELLGER